MPAMRPMNTVLAQATVAVIFLRRGCHSRAMGCRLW
jgi:hypothetical protein